MITLTGYHLKERLYQGIRTEVYRGTRTNDRQPVIIKVLRNPHPNFNELIQFRNQYIITSHLEHRGIVRPLALERYGNGYGLVMPDSSDIALSDYWQECDRSLGEFLNIAIQLADALHYLNQQRIIHKDIKPANILICPQTHQVKLIDFSISSLLPLEQQQLTNPNVLEGTLAYISPEQTGRMNRGIDYRTDFYSLGVTFYEMLVGQLPFTSDDPMELVHCHIAKMPILGKQEARNPVSLRNRVSGTLPQVLIDIVLKLMAKNAEDRYQSALGLKHDLEQCLQQLEDKGEITSFEIGQRDICDRFLIPEKLYGRKKEVAQLLAAFHRVASSPSSPSSKSELLLVAGFSGIGKTAVVNEVHKPIVKQRGYFIKGKFDQFNRNIPFSAFVQAFRDLIGQLLGSSDADLTNWKTNILDALGDNAQVIIDVVPELEKIIGQQPSVPELSGSAAQNRFNLVFGKFVRVFTRKEHPLVIFLDDLQWADSASLNLLELLIHSSDVGYLLVLGAYRDNEVFPAHSLMLTLSEIQKLGAIVHTLTLDPLGEGDITHLVADTLLCSRAIATPFSDLVYQKTQGNPFFTTQFLQGLYEDDCIIFEPALGYWQCDLARVRQLALTDDVVAFMVGRLRKLPVATQDVLKLAACIGNQFDLETLALGCEQDRDEVAVCLWMALQEGFVIPQSETYKFFQGTQSEDNGVEAIAVGYRFLHDRVQQAAYSLIADEQKQITHLKIGKLLLRKYQDTEREENIFDIVNQLNIGWQLIIGQTERNDLARLNLKAARKANASTAYSGALDYLTVGIQLLAADSWQTEYDLTLALYTEAIENSYLNAEFEKAENYSEWTLERVNNILDTVKIYELKINQKIAEQKAEEALEIGLQVLNSLGISREQILDYGNREVILPQVEYLANAPEMIDPYKLASMRLLMSLTSASTIAKPELLLPIIVTQIHLYLEGGNANTTAFSYAWYGSILCGELGEIDKGYQAGQLALKLLEQFEAISLSSQVMTMVYLFIYPWKTHLSQVLDPALDSFKIGLENGDVLYGSYSIFNYCVYLLLSGHNLQDVLATQTFYIDALRKQRIDFSASLILFWKYLALKLQGLSGEELYELLVETVNELGPWGFFALHLVQGILLYLSGDCAESAVECVEAKEYILGVGGWPAIGIHNFYYSLSLLDLYPSADKISQQQYLKEVAANQEKMLLWAEKAPMNYQHKYDLVEAEYHRILGLKIEAMELYDRSIAYAKENGYVQEEALANELAAKFYRTWGFECAKGSTQGSRIANGKEKLAGVYMQEAYYCYARWGALAKTNQLEKTYPELLDPIIQKSKFQLNSHQTSHQTSTQSFGTVITTSSLFDLAAVLKASQAISGEISLKALLSKLIEIIIKNAGADRAALILDNSGSWEISAWCDRSNCHLLNTPLEESNTLPKSIINTVKRTRETVLINDLEKETTFAYDPYLMEQPPKSLLCTAIVNQGKLIGILYLENNLSAGAFTPERIEVLNLLVTQAAISIENARLYHQLEDYSHNLEAKVEQRTEELQGKNQQLQQTLEQLQRTQAQLIQTEKMSSLGQIVAGVAHEINNPITFISGNIEHAREYFKDLFDLINVYEQNCPDPNSAIQDKVEEIELEFLCDDLEQMFGSMEQGSDRIRKIILGLRNFSRLDEVGLKRVDIHEGLENTLMILQHRLRNQTQGREIQIQKNYDKLPKVNCYANQLNQVFLNIFTNAIDILTTSEAGTNPKITITTEIHNEKTVRISIADNGPGMSENVRQKVFDPFFTTKPVGKGTGLGLSTSYQIITEQHGGQLYCVSQPGKGTEFIMEIPIY